MRGDPCIVRCVLTSRPSPRSWPAPAVSASVVVDENPSDAIVDAAEEEESTSWSSATSGMSGRKEFLLGNVPNRISHNARCTVVIVNSAERSRTTRTRAVWDGSSGGPMAAARRQSTRPMSRGSSSAGPRADRAGDGEARPEGAVRQARVTRRAEPMRARARRLRDALEELGPDVLQARPDPLHAPGPRAAGVHRGAVDAAGQASAAHRAAGRRSDGGRAPRPLGGRLRADRPEAARRRHDRPGAPRDARRRRRVWS